LISAEVPDYGEHRQAAEAISARYRQQPLLTRGKWKINKRDDGFSAWPAIAVHSLRAVKSLNLACGADASQSTATVKVVALYSFLNKIGSFRR